MSNETGCIQCSECIDRLDEYCRFCGIRQYIDKKKIRVKFNPVTLIDEEVLSPEYLDGIRKEVMKIDR